MKTLSDGRIDTDHGYDDGKLMREGDDALVPFTLAHRRRIDRVERAVSGYTDEGGVFIPGLLQNTADGVKAVGTLKRVAYALAALALLNVLHLYGFADIAKAIILGGK